MRICLIIIWVIVISGCLQRQSDQECSRFRAGRFLIKDRISHNNYVINRIDSIQTELDSDIDTITIIKIKWTSPCEYEVLREYKRKNTIDPNSKHIIQRYVNEVPLKVRITATDKDYYVFESKEEGNGFVYKDTMWVVK